MDTSEQALPLETESIPYCVRLDFATAKRIFLIAKGRGVHPADLAGAILRETVHSLPVQQEIHMDKGPCRYGGLEDGCREWIAGCSFSPFVT